MPAEQKGRGNKMKQLFETLLRAMDQGRDTVLVTIAASSGSTPRGAGARMLVTASGRECGTIGGGMVEYRAQQVAAEVLETKSSRTEDFVLRKSEVQDLGMICGGDVTVDFFYMAGGDGETAALCRAALAALDGQERCWLVTDVTPGRPGGLTLCRAGERLAGSPLTPEVLGAMGWRPCRVETGDGSAFYIETLTRPGRVYIFGGGHVAQALVPVLRGVDFRCIVLEDREEFCRPELFPGAEECRLVEMEDIRLAVPVTEEDMICIITRGHACDFEAEAFALGTAAGYIGVIGSRKKTETINARLLERGFTQKDLARVTTPIGLNIRAETPAEIAISIAAQLILHRANR